MYKRQILANEFDEKIKIGKKTFKRKLEKHKRFEDLTHMTMTTTNKSIICEKLKTSKKFLTAVKIIKKAKKKGEKVLLFDRNIEHLPHISVLLPEHGIKSLLFTTDYSPKYREKILEKFKTDDYNVLLSSYRMMAEGHNITEANHIIFYAPSRSKKDYIQCLSLIHI